MALTIPPATLAAEQTLAEIDRLFAIGFGRAGDAERQTLGTLTALFDGTPLGGQVGSAMTALQDSRFLADHFRTLAFARSALTGAMHDALSHACSEWLGVESSSTFPPPSATDAEATGNAFAQSTQEWLSEVALSGFGQLEPDTLAPFAGTLSQLPTQPNATRLAAVLTGFHRELSSAVPTASRDDLPLRRWTDLWTRAMLTASVPFTPEEVTEINGDLLPLAVDLHHHGGFVSATAYGLLTIDDDVRLTRITLSGYRVEVISGPDLWKLLPSASLPLWEAFRRRQRLALMGAQLLPTGELLSLGETRLTGRDSPWVAAQTYFSIEPEANCERLRCPPTDRHPVLFGEFVALDDYTIKNDHLTLGDGTELRLLSHRHSTESELPWSSLAKSNRMLGLLRYDAGEWGLSPLRISQAKPTVLDPDNNNDLFTGSGAADAMKAKSKKTDTLLQLQERASRLLRPKK